MRSPGTNRTAAAAAALATLLTTLPATAQPAVAPSRSWSADNGNGTYTNPLFYDEFSDPDMIRVGDDYYLTGTTMHTMPGLPILHSRDLVNWRNIGYAFQRLDLGPEFRLEDGKEIYGQGIWAPSFRHHNGVFYIFANVNRFGLQVFRATDPRGPWQHNRIPQALHDLSVLFDDDGKIYAVYGAGTLRIVELNAGLTAIVPGTDRVLLEREMGMGEGAHFYKIRGRYFIVSAMPGAHTPMRCARADRLSGPWEVETISEKESLGIGQGHTLRGRWRQGPPFEIAPPNPDPLLGLTLHQGGIIDTPGGEWWGYSMQDHNSVGRLTSLSPVTWKDGWPYFGLPGNLTRTPNTWAKPETGPAAPITAPYDRSDDFAGPTLKPVWQWNHRPSDAHWSLTERPGYLRLRSLPAKDFWWARNTLTQRAVGPESTVTAELDVSRLADGDTAGLALLNLPWAWIGVVREQGRFAVRQFDQTTGKAAEAALSATRLRLRVECNFDSERAVFAYSLDGSRYVPLGGPFTTVFQLKTFQGVRYGLFHYNASGTPGGALDVNAFDVAEPRSRPRIPLGLRIHLRAGAGGVSLTVRDGAAQSSSDQGTAFLVKDMGRGRVALQAANGQFVSVTWAGAAREVRTRAGEPGKAETFQWVDLGRGDIQLLSLFTNRYLRVPLTPGPAAADHQSPASDRKDGSCFQWSAAPAP
ncbi:MAG TPA: glycoside hydrolase [Solibacterales bacterium]|nr:glycoside hydrolase [Bryobacterales bacterium]